MGVFTVWLLALIFTLASLLISYFLIRSKKPDWLSEKPGAAVAFAALFATLTLAFPTEALYSKVINDPEPETNQTVQATENPTEPSGPSLPSEKSEPPVQTTPPSPSAEDDEGPAEPSEEGAEAEAGGQNPQTESGSGPPPGRDASTPLTVQIEIDDNSKIGMETWKAVHNMRAWANVFDQYGDIEDGCFASVEVTKDGEVIYSTQGTCTTSFGLGTRQYGSGEITISFSIETEWGATGSDERTIIIVTD